MKQKHFWAVVPLSPGQLRDVRGIDVLAGGLFRKCSTYRGGGGYDQFPEVCRGFTGRALSEQFIVQLRGCNLDCPYCYVTRAGVWGAPTAITAAALVDAFIESKQQVFHLMGGAPALYRRHWPELITALLQAAPEAVFHSDLMLTENRYRQLSDIAHPRAIYAVNIKGLNAAEFERNTRKPLDWSLFWENWRAVARSGIQYYVTFTGVDVSGLPDFWELAARNGVERPPTGRVHNIPIISYEASDEVDRTTWGAK